MSTDEPTHATESSPVATTEVPPDETTHDCPYCGRPFSDPEYRTLHVGLDHHVECSEEELEAFQAAYREETEAIRLFRLKAIGALVLLYFGFLFTYSFVT